MPLGRSNSGLRASSIVARDLLSRRKMSVYFDHLVQFPGSSTSLRNVRHHLMSWHSSYSILAVASRNEENGRDGSVNFFLDEVSMSPRGRGIHPFLQHFDPLKIQGEVVEDASIYRSVVVECMEWHSESKIIAVGWQSGEITTYNHSEEKVHEQSSIHRSPITVIQWNQNGSRLISGDKVRELIASCTRREKNPLYHRVDSWWFGRWTLWGSSTPSPSTSTASTPPSPTASCCTLPP